jgi:hypothetical protein
MKQQSPASRQRLRSKVDQYRRLIVEHCAQRADTTLCPCDLCEQAFRFLGVVPAEVLR